MSKQHCPAANNNKKLGLANFPIALDVLVNVNMACPLLQPLAVAHNVMLLLEYDLKTQPAITLYLAYICI